MQSMQLQKTAAVAERDASARNVNAFALRFVRFVACSTISDNLHSVVLRADDLFD